MNAEEMEKWLIKPRRYARHRGDEKRALVFGSVETASMHDPGKEAAQRPPKERRKTLNLKTFPRRIAGLRKSDS